VPDTSAPHWLHEIWGKFGFESNDVSAVVGMKTRTPGTGSGEPVFQAVCPPTWMPAYTVPVMLVVVPPSHATWCSQYVFVQGVLLPQTFALPLPPHTSPVGHVPPHGPIVPPQPSPAMPQL
jgi:hypothetical protein